MLTEISINSEIKGYERERERERDLALIPIAGSPTFCDATSKAVFIVLRIFCCAFIYIMCSY